MDSSNFFEKLKNSTYGEEYLRIISEGRKDLKYEKGFERHHILPRSLGGTNEKQNLVKLTTFQHVLAHYYLALGYPSKETVGAFSCITRFHQFKHLSELEQISLQQLEHWADLREQAVQERSKNSGSNTRNRVWMNFRGERDIRVLPEHVETYKKQGWSLGRSSSAGEKIRQGRANSEKPKKVIEPRKWVVNPETNEGRQVKVSELSQFLQENPEWKLGGAKYTLTEEQKQRKRESQKASTKNRKGWVWYTNGDQDIRISPESIQEYEIRGFWKGKSHGWGSKEAMPEIGRARGTVWVSNKEQRKRIQKNLVDSWLKENPGWIKGNKYVSENN